MKLAGIFTLLLAAVWTPLVSARLTLLRLASLDQPSKLRGLAPRPEPSAYEANLYVDMDANSLRTRVIALFLFVLETLTFFCLFIRAFRELMTFWKDASMSVSYSMPVPPRPVPKDPSPAEIPGFGFFPFYSMSMSMSMPAGPGFGLADTVYNPAAPDEDGGGTPSTTGGDATSPTTTVDDAGSSTSGEPPATTDGTDTTTGGDGAETTNIENLGKGASSSSGASTPQTILMVVLVGAAVAVLSAWYVRKNQRVVSSNVSQMTPPTAPLL